jgi:quinone-modifying oxidoreductase, subunit QmoB
MSNNGIYLCEGCGISDAISIDGLETLANGDLGAATCRRHDAFCSDEGVALIAADVADGSVDRPIVAACSQRVMADRFDFDGAHVVRANLREQVAWSHAARDEDTNMLAADALRIAVAQAGKSSAPTAGVNADVSRQILVVGGGASGLTAALEATRAGHPVTLVERSDSLGGWARKWSRRLPHKPPYRDPQENQIEALIGEIEGNASITVKTGVTVTSTSGMPGKFEVAFSDGGSETVGAIVAATGWREYDATKLGHLGYGASPDVVTNVELEAMLRDGPVTRKHVAFVQCAGSRDADHLPYCSSICCAVSIKHALQIKQADPSASVYIVYEEMRTPGTAEEFYRQAQEEGVIFMKGKVKSVGADLTVVYDDELLGEEIPLMGLDMVVLATGMVPNSTNIEADAMEAGADQLAPDINPVAPINVAGFMDGAEPEPWPRAEEATPPGAPILNLQYRQGPHLPMLADGFADSHFICFPYETRRTGIYTCGPLRRPMGIAESAEDAAGAVLKAIQAIHNAAEGAAVHPRSGDLSFPNIGFDICTKCRRCTVECPFGAIDEDENDYPVVNTTRCRRCGTCMGACPVRTISFDNYSVDMVSEMIKSIDIPDEFSEKPRILIMACENDAYPALDMAGVSRNQYSAHVRIIPVRCLGSVSSLWVSDALSRGFDGIMLMGCKSGDDYQCHFIKGSAIAKDRTDVFQETLSSLMLEEERLANVEVSIADSDKVADVINGFAETIGAMEPNPFKGF